MKFYITYYAVLGALFGWYISYEIFYSPKAQVRRLWKEIWKVHNYVVKMEKKYPGSFYTVKGNFLLSIEKKKLVIISLLQNYCDSEADETYINENMPKLDPDFSTYHKNFK